MFGGDVAHLKAEIGKQPAEGIRSRRVFPDVEGLSADSFCLCLLAPHGDHLRHDAREVGLHEPPPEGAGGALGHQIEDADSETLHRAGLPPGRRVALVQDRVQEGESGSPRCVAGRPAWRRAAGRRFQNLR